MKLDHVATIGDSIAAGYIDGGTDTDKPWPELAGIPKQNRLAVSGTTAEQWAHDWRGMLTEAKAHPARVVLCTLMGNDFIAAAQDGHISVVEVTAAYAALWDVLQALRPRTVYIMTYADPYQGAQPKVTEVVDFVNEQIEAVTDLAHVHLLPVGDILTAEHFDGKGIHPNPAGQQAIADYVLTKLG